MPHRACDDNTELLLENIFGKHNLSWGWKRIQVDYEFTNISFIVLSSPSLPSWSLLPSTQHLLPPSLLITSPFYTTPPPSFPPGHFYLPHNTSFLPSWSLLPSTQHLLPSLLVTSPFYTTPPSFPLGHFSLLHNTSYSLPS